MWLILLDLRSLTIQFKFDSIQFQSFLAEADNTDVIYFSQVHWLSRAATLTRFWSLRQEMKYFMTDKGKDLKKIDFNL